MIDQIYREHGHVVLRRARWLLGSESEARDAFHEIFLSLLDRPEQLRGVTRITAWLYRATTHHCLNALRNRRTRARILSSMDPAPPDAGTRGEQLVRVRALLAQLPAPLDEVAVYTYVDEMTHEEVASALGCSRRKVGYLIEQLHRVAQIAEPSPPPAPLRVRSSPSPSSAAARPAEPASDAPGRILRRPLKEQPS